MNRLAARSALDASYLCPVGERVHGSTVKTHNALVYMRTATSNFRPPYRQLEEKSCPLSQHALDPDAAAVRFDQALGYCQSQPSEEPGVSLDATLDTRLSGYS